MSENSCKVLNSGTSARTEEETNFEGVEHHPSQQPRKHHKTKSLRTKNTKSQLSCELFASLTLQEPPSSKSSGFVANHVAIPPVSPIVRSNAYEKDVFSPNHIIDTLISRTNAPGGDQTV